jgi:hypothetical protein
MQQFPLFSSHIDLAHQLWERVLQQGDTAIDATCGNGKDTLKLGQILQKKGGGHLLGLDIQEEALRRTQERLSSAGVSGSLFLQSHRSLPTISSPLRLLVYNLGYLPGGDKKVTTQTETTLESVKNHLSLITCGGMISITCYSGHEEGAKEERALLDYCSTLAPSEWSVCHHRWLNRPLAPSLLILQKNI